MVCENENIHIAAAFPSWECLNIQRCPQRLLRFTQMPASVCWLDEACWDSEKDSCGCLGSGPHSIPLWMLTKILHHWGLHLFTCKTEQGGLSDLCNSFQLTTYFHNVIWKSDALEPGRVVSQPLFLKTNLNWLEPSHTEWCKSWLFSHGSLPFAFPAYHTSTISATPPCPMVSHCASCIRFVGLP